MASTIRIKRSSVAGKSPNTSNLSTGELALNLADKKIYSSNGTAVFEIGSDSFSNKKTFTVTNSGSSAYSFSGVGTGEGFANSNPTLYLTRGETYTFSLNASGHPFYINTVNATGTGNQYANGVSGQGTQVGTLTFTVPMNAPKKLYYNCQYHSGMNGTIYIPNEKDIDASTFQTKSDAVTSNNTLVSLIEDRLQVANVQPLLDRYLQVANSSTFVTQSTLDGYLQVANGVQVINSVSTSLFSNNNLSVTTPLANLDFNDRVVANPNGHITFTTNEGYELKVPYFSAPGVEMGDGTITVTAGDNSNLNQYLQVANVQPLLDKYLQVANSGSIGGGSTNSFGTINVSGTNLVSQTSNTSVSILGTGGITVTGYAANNTLLIDGSSVSGGGGGASVTVSDSAPGSPSAGDLWFDSEDLILYVYYDDGSSSQWVKSIASGIPTPIALSTSAPSSANEGDLWFDTNLLKLYIYYNDGDSSQWIEINSLSGNAESGGSASSNFVEKTANAAIVAGEKFIVDTSVSAITITLPSSASIGDEVRIIDGAGFAANNNITVARNGHKIQGSASDLVIDTNRAGFGLVYYNTTNGWVLIER